MKLGFLGCALLLLWSSAAWANPSDLVEMWEKCRVSHVFGGPAPVIVTLTFFDNGDIEYSDAVNHRIRTSRPPKVVHHICNKVLFPLLDQTKHLEPLMEDQHDAESFFVSTADSNVRFPRRSVRIVVNPDGTPDVVEEDVLSSSVKELLRELDARATAIFGRHHEYRFLRDAN